MFTYYLVTVQEFHDTIRASYKTLQSCMNIIGKKCVLSKAYFSVKGVLLGCISGMFLFYQCVSVKEKSLVVH